MTSFTISDNDLDQIRDQVVVITGVHNCDYNPSTLLINSC